MNEKLKEFFMRLVDDTEFREEFASVQSAMEGYSKAKPYIEGISFEEFKEGLRLIHDEISHGKTEKLSDAELKRVSGGTNMFAEVLKGLQNVEMSFIKSLFRK